MEWVALAGLIEEAVFRGIDRWGHVSTDSLHIDSLVPLLGSMFADAGIAFAAQYSCHLSRGRQKAPVLPFVTSYRYGRIRHQAATCMSRRTAERK